MSFNIKTEVNWEEETCLAANWEQCGFLFDRMISIDEITGLTLGLKFAVRLSIDEGRDPIFEIKVSPGSTMLGVLRAGTLRVLGARLPAASTIKSKPTLSK